MKLRKRALTIFMAFCAVSGLAAAGNQETAAEGPVTLNVWTLWTETSDDINAKAFFQVLEEARAAFPEFVIEHDGTENEAYKTKIKTAMAADDVPDAFFSWGAGFIRPFVAAGKVEALDPYLQDGTADRIKGGANTNFEFDGKTYGLTFTQWVAALYCNKELFRRYGVALPDDYDQLLSAVKTFRENDIVPITVGEKDRWPGMFWQNAFAVKTAGAAASNAALAGNGRFDTPEFVQSAELLEQLVAAGGFVDGALGLDYNEGGALFLNGEAAMYYMGNWFAGDITAAGESFASKIEARKFPVVSGGKGDGTQFLGGSVDGMCVSADSAHKAEAAELTKYLMEQIARNLTASGDGLPTWDTSDVVSVKSNPIIDQIKALISDSSGYVLAWDTFLSGADADDHKNYVAELFAQALSPEDFAARMQAMNE